MSLMIGQKLFIVASSAEAAKEFFKVHDANFSSRPFKRAFQVLMSNDIAFVEGNTRLRRHLRKIFQQELTSAKRIQETEHVRTGEISKMIKAVPEARVIKIRLYFEVMITNVLSLMVFKKQYLSMAGKDDGNSAEEIKVIDLFTQTINDIAVNISRNNIGDVVPVLRWLDPQGLESRYRQVIARMDAFSSNIIFENGSGSSNSTRPNCLAQASGFRPHQISRRIPDCQRHFDLLPYGSSRRSCPAIELGHLKFTLIFTNLLHAFHWSVPDQEELEDDTESFDHVASKAVPVTAVVQRRLPPNLYL